MQPFIRSDMWGQKFRVKSVDHVTMPSPCPWRLTLKFFKLSASPSPPSLPHRVPAAAAAAAVDVDVEEGNENGSSAAPKHEAE